MIGGMGSSFNWSYTNVANASTTPGTSVVPGASDAEGAWTQVATAANIAQEVWGFYLWVAGGATTATAKNHLLDIGVDEAGGTSYTARLDNLACGQSATAVSGGIRYYFPLHIKAGSSVAVRIQGTQATAGTVRVGVKFYGKPSRPEMARTGQYTETIGTISASLGVSFTPGNTNAEGTWVSLGTTVKPLWWWQIGMQINNGTTTALGYAIDLAYGDVTNKVMIIENMFISVPGTTEMTMYDNTAHLAECYREVPAGSTIYIRGTCSGTAATGFNAVAIGVGG